MGTQKSGAQVRRGGGKSPKPMEGLSREQVLALVKQLLSEAQKPAEEARTLATTESFIPVVGTEAEKKRLWDAVESFALRNQSMAKLTDKLSEILGAQGDVKAIVEDLASLGAHEMRAMKAAFFLLRSATDEARTRAFKKPGKAPHAGGQGPQVQSTQVQGPGHQKKDGKPLKQNLGAKLAAAGLAPEAPAAPEQVPEQKS